MYDIQSIADILSGLSDQELKQLSTVLVDHPNNINKIGLTSDGDPVPPDPTHPHT